VRRIVWIALLGACSSSEELPPPDTESEDTGEEQVDVCAPDGMPTGNAVGTVDCAEGVCTVAGGAFWRGQPGGGDADACPLHQVELSTFRIDQHETTMRDYRNCVNAGVCSDRASECDSIYSSWQGESKELPVVCVDFYQAATYCEWVDGRLPTEAEWEKAARGDEGAVYPWGSRAPLCEDANFRFVSWYCEQSVVEVGTYSATTTAYGLMDTVGNAWEWTADAYDATWYVDASREDPVGPESCSVTPGVERGECTHRVIRGGGFNSTEQNTRASMRSLSEPERYDVNLGFRCAYD